MSTFIDLQDGCSWWAANWAYDAVIEMIADELTGSELETELAVFLRTQTCTECGPGLGSIDLRELTEQCRIAFCESARRALQTATTRGGSSWQQPEFFPKWLAKFEELVEMMDTAERDKPHIAEGLN